MGSNSHHRSHAAKPLLHPGVGMSRVSPFGHAHPSRETVKSRNQDQNRDQAEIDALELLCDEKVDGCRAASGDERKCMRLPPQLLHVEETINDGEREREEDPNDRKPRLRGLVPCERGKKRGRSPGVQPCGGLAIGCVLLGTPARNGIESCRTAEQRQIAIEWVRGFEIEGQQRGDRTGSQHVFLESEIAEAKLPPKKAQCDCEPRPYGCDPGDGQFR